MFQIKVPNNHYISHASSYFQAGSYSSSSSLSPYLSSPFQFLATSLYLLRYSFRRCPYSQNPNTSIDASRSYPLIVFRFSILHFQQASLVIKEMNQETHSCTVYLASLAILAFSGSAFFIILPILAMGRKREQFAAALSQKIYIPVCVVVDFTHLLSSYIQFINTKIYKTYTYLFKLVSLAKLSGIKIGKIQSWQMIFYLIVNHSSLYLFIGHWLFLWIFWSLPLTISFLFILFSWKCLTQSVLFWVSPLLGLITDHAKQLLTRWASLKTLYLNSSLTFETKFVNYYVKQDFFLQNFIYELIKLIKISSLKMGNGIFSQCRTVKGQNNIQPVILGDTNDPDEPERTYAFPETVKYQSPCNVSHVLSEILPLNIPQNIERGKNYNNSYFLVPYGIYYTGEWKKGRPHGVGSAVFQNGSILKGTFLNGQTRGSDCILVMQDGSYYRGNIQQNKFSGKGVYRQQNGHNYDGDWSQNVPHGFGRQQFANGDYYKGQYVEGVKKGKGIYRWKNHPQFIEYSGQFEDDQIKGSGVLTKTQDRSISGIFKGLKDIQNAIIKSKNFQYRGSVKNGLLEGQGSMISQNGRKKYEGNFKFGQPHGYGTLTLSNGEKKSGNWFKGNLIRDYKGLTDYQLEKGLTLIQDEFSTKIYVEDALQSINNSLKIMGYNAVLIQSKEANKGVGQKYLIVDLANDNKAIIIRPIGIF